MTQSAVKIYQRQNKLAQDGIIGPDTLEAILSPDAKYYAAQKGDEGTDITRIQSRLYEAWLSGQRQRGDRQLWR